MWHKPEGEVTVYSIRISYEEDISGQLQYQLLTPTTTTWVALHVMDLPSQRPLWIEVMTKLLCEPYMHLPDKLSVHIVHCG